MKRIIKAIRKFFTRVDYLETDFRNDKNWNPKKFIKAVHRRRKLHPEFFDYNPDDYPCNPV